MWDDWVTSHRSGCVIRRKKTSIPNGPDIPATTEIIGLHSAAPPAMHNEVAIARFFNPPREIRHDGERKILV
jgi:hypothetical protein